MTSLTYLYLRTKIPPSLFLNSFPKQLPSPLVHQRPACNWQDAGHASAHGMEPLPWEARGPVWGSQPSLCFPITWGAFEKQRCPGPILRDSKCTDRWWGPGSGSVPKSPWGFHCAAGVSTHWSYGREVGTELQDRGVRGGWVPPGGAREGVFQGGPLVQQVKKSKN